MAHYIEEKIKFYLDKVNSNPDMLSDLLLNQAKEAVGKALQKQFNEINGKFRLSMSTVGKPLCQLHMQANGMKRLPPEYNMPLRMLYGDIIEALMVVILKAAGVNVQSEQEPVELTLDWGTDKRLIKGTLDLVIDDKVWDVKSVSPWVFANKDTYEKIREDDPFGYVGQLYMYAKAKGKKVGGWITVDKSSGEVHVIEFPEDQEIHQQEKLVDVTNNVKELVEKAPFRRSFTDVAEKFRKKETGNRTLCKTCEFCDWRFECWPNLIHSKALRSEAANPPWKYYTHIGAKDETPISES